MQSEPKGYRALKESIAWTPIWLSCFELGGPDAAEWLHGQVTQDISSMKEGDVRGACLCAVTGQIRSVLTVHRFSDRFEIHLPTSTTDFLERRFNETVFMEEVTLEQREPVRDWFGRAGWTSPPNYEEASAEAWEAVRLEEMIPEWGKDIDEKTFPQELGKRFEAMHVSYTKGCYTGQEVLMRIHSRGHTNRSWVQLRCDFPVEPGFEVSDITGRKVGQVTSAAFSPELGPLAAAMVRIEAAQVGTKLRIGEIGARVANSPAET